MRKRAAISASLIMTICTIGALGATGTTIVASASPSRSVATTPTAYSMPASRDLFRKPLTPRPVVTPTPSKPAPVVTPRATHTASRPPTTPAPRPTVTSHVVAHSTAFPAILYRIRSCESGSIHDGSPGDVDWTDQNPHSTASGGYQVLDSTWSGYGGYSRAMYAPPAVQDQYAVALLNEEGTRPWASSEPCWG